MTLFELGGGAIACLELDWTQAATALVAAIVTAAAAAAKVHRPAGARTRASDERPATVTPAEDWFDEDFELETFEPLKGYEDPATAGRLRRAARELRTR